MNYLQLVDYESWIYKQGPDPTDTLAILWNNNNEVQAAIALMNGYIACAERVRPPAINRTTPGRQTRG